MRFISLAAVMLLALPAQAAVDLFQARVPVADQSAPAREMALTSALAVVLVRVTGDANITQSPDAGALMNRAATYVQGTSYEQSAEVLWLKATFNGPALIAALRVAGLPVWSADRPTHLLWIALDGEPATLISQEDKDSVQALLEAAEVRGVPMLLPRGDAADLDAVKPADVFVGVADPLLKAAARYNTDQVVSAWVSQTGSSGTRWSANWSLLSAKGTAEQWQSTGGSAAAALAAGVSHLADFEARQFALRGLSPSTTETALEVVGIQTLADYARTLNYLKKLELTKSVNVGAVEGNRVLFRINLTGSETQLTRVIAAGSVLREASATARGALGYSLVR